MMPVFLTPDGKRRLSPSGKLNLGASGQGCCCALYRIQNACTLASTSFGVSSIPTGGRYFWGDEYTAQGLTAGTLYRVSDTQAAGLSAISVTSAIDNVFPVSVTIGGIVAITSCQTHAFTGVPGGPWDQWRFNATSDEIDALYEPSTFSWPGNCGFTGNGDTAGVDAYRSGSGCGGGFYAFSYVSRTIMRFNQQKMQVIMGVFVGSNILFAWFYGEADLPAAPTTGLTTITLNNLLYESPDPIAVGTFGNQYFPIGEGGTVEFSW